MKKNLRKRAREILRGIEERDQFSFFADAGIVT